MRWQKLTDVCVLKRDKTLCSRAATVYDPNNWQKTKALISARYRTPPIWLYDDLGLHNATHFSTCFSSSLLSGRRTCACAHFEAITRAFWRREHNKPVFFFFRYGRSAKRKENKYNVPALVFPSSHECSHPCDKLSYCCVWGSSTQCSTCKPQGTVNRLATLTFLLHAVATLMNARSTSLQGLWKLFLVSLKASGIAALPSFLLGLYAPGHKLNARRVQFASGALRAFYLFGYYISILLTYSVRIVFVQLLQHATFNWQNAQNNTLSAVHPPNYI